MITTTSKSLEHYKRAKEIIPGGTQLLSKRPEMFLPDYWPAYYDRAKGCEVWDLDGNHYYDFAYMGVGANLLGYCDPDVDDAIVDVIRKGTNTTLNAPEEVELTEMLLDIHPWADMARFTRTGGEAMAVAVRIARASTGKDKVLFSGYHGWHDWYISANLSNDQLKDGHLIPGLEPTGVPRVLRDTAIPFTYNNTEEFLEKFEANKNELGAIVIESVRNFEPDPEFFKLLRKKCDENNVVLILDEITAGFRMNIGGAHLRYGIEPDMTTFGKAMSNGYCMAAILGKKKVMEAAQKSFISSLFWTERLGLISAIATINKMKKIDSPSKIIAIGERVQKEWKEIAAVLGVEITISGFPAVSSFGFKHEHPLAVKTYFTQEMLKKGFLATTALYASCAHEEHLDKYLHAFKETLEAIKMIMVKGENFEDHLMGPVCHSGFKRLT